MGVAGMSNPQGFLSQFNEAGQIKHRSLPAILIAGPAHMSQIEHQQVSMLSL